jgi:hypothetical protein
MIPGHREELRLFLRVHRRHADLHLWGCTMRRRGGPQDEHGGHSWVEPASQKCSAVNLLSAHSLVAYPRAPLAVDPRESSHDRYGLTTVAGGQGMGPKWSSPGLCSNCVSAQRRTFVNSHELSEPSRKPESSSPGAPGSCRAVVAASASWSRHLAEATTCPEAAWN